MAPTYRWRLRRRTARRHLRTSRPATVQPPGRPPQRPLRSHQRTSLRLARLRRPILALPRPYALRSTLLLARYRNRLLPHASRCQRLPADHAAHLGSHTVCPRGACRRRSRRRLARRRSRRRLQQHDLRRGDGVITRRSATSLPGQWSFSSLNVETEALPGKLHGRGPPFGKKPGKGRMKVDRYRMRFDGGGGGRERT